MSRRITLIVLQLAFTVMLMAEGRRVLFIGDSITDGAWGNSGVWNASSDERNQQDMNHIYGHGYMMIAASRFQSLYPEEGWQFWNRGISGNTLDDLEGRWQKDVLDLHPDVVSILIGTNDVEQALNEGKTLDTLVWGNKFRALLDVTLRQNPQTLFVKKTVREDLFEVFQGTAVPKQAQQNRTAHIVQLCRLETLLDRHPYDRSGGEQQRVALAKVLLLEPEILLMDEPTKGLDAEFKQTLAEILQRILRSGVTVVMVSHDVEFCAAYAHRCAMFFDGSIVNDDTPRAFFAGNSFYTTSVGRMCRRRIPGAVTVSDAVTVCGGTLPPTPTLPEPKKTLPEPTPQSADWKPKPLPRWRKLIAAFSLLTALVIFIQAIGVTDLTNLTTASGLSDTATGRLLQYIICLAALAIFAAAIGRRSPAYVQPTVQRGKASRRTICACVMILLCIPATLFVGLFCLETKQYYITILLVMAECMLPFLLIFEGRKPQARELVLIAVLCAIGVASRALFFMLPEFKPVIAITIIAGVALGGESGFLVGAMVILVSNMLFGQGPWTPWQMFALGIIGFLAGVLFRKGLLRRSRASLCVYGVFASIVIYGGIMNPMAELTWAREFNWNMLLTYYITGFPLDCIQGVATALFLWFAAEPMLEKLDRIKVKYGLVEYRGSTADKAIR